MKTTRIAPIARGAALLLCLMAFAIQGFAVTVVQSQVQKSATGSNCTPPAAVNSFAQSDVDIWAYFLVSGAQAGDNAQIDWFDPDGKYGAGYYWDALSSSGTYCFSNAISSTAVPYKLAVGNWTVRLKWNGTYISTVNFTVTAAPTSNAYELGFYMTTGALANGPAPCSAPTAKSDFLTTDGSVIVFFYFKTFGPGLNLTEEIYSPDGQLYGKTGWNPVSSVGDWCFWDSGTMKIANTSMATKPGKWAVKVFVNGDPLFTTNFNLAAAGATTSDPITLSTAAVQAGYKVSLFADNFPSNSGGVGPVGIAFPDSGGVLVSELTGGIRKFATRIDGQHADSVPKASDFGQNSGGGMAKSGGRIYVADQQAGRLVQLNDDGTVNQVVVASGLLHDAGLATNPLNGHIFISVRQVPGTPDRIVDFDPVAKTFVTFKSGVSADGISFAPDGSVLYGAMLDTTHIIGYRVTDGTQVFDSGAINGADGCVVGNGKLAGLLFVNTNDGRVVQVDLKTSAQTVLATGGSRGDLIAVDPYDGSLLLTQTDKIIRLSPPAGGSFAPAAAVTGVANAADFSPSVAPGSLASLFGTNLAPGVASAAAVPVATTLNGVTVNVNGRPAPITYLSPTQINFQVPVATPAGAATITVTIAGQTSSPLSFSVAAAAPAIFQYGANRGIVVNQDYTLNTTAKPAAVGETVTAYLTGIGATTPAVPDGAASPGGPFAVPPGKSTATIGGVTAPVVFLGLSPGFVGLAQANITVPAMATGDYPLVVNVNGVNSRSVLMSVAGSAPPAGGGNTPAGLPQGAKCVSGKVDYITFSLATKASRMADEVSIGGTKLCAKCDLAPPIYGNFADKLEAASTEGNAVDVCYDTYGTLNYLRIRP